LIPAYMARSAERDEDNALTSRITETLRELGPAIPSPAARSASTSTGDDFCVDLLLLPNSGMSSLCSRPLSVPGAAFTRSIHEFDSVPDPTLSSGILSNVSQAATR
jgi:hypothetical protein